MRHGSEEGRARFVCVVVVSDPVNGDEVDRRPCRTRAECDRYSARMREAGLEVACIPCR